MDVLMSIKISDDHGQFICGGTYNLKPGNPDYPTMEQWFKDLAPFYQEQIAKREARK